MPCFYTEDKKDNNRVPEPALSLLLHFLDLAVYFIEIVTEPLLALLGIIALSMIKHLDEADHINGTKSL